MRFTTGVDGTHGWCIVFASFMVMVITLGQLYSFSVLFHPLQDEFKSSKTMTALIGGFFAGFLDAFGLFSGFVIDFLGHRHVLMIGGVVLSGAVFLSSWSTSFTWMLFLYGFGGGTGMWLSFTAPYAIVPFWFTKRRALAIGVISSGGGFGSIAIAHLLNTLICKYGWRVALRIFSAITLFIVESAAVTFKLPSDVTHRVKGRKVTIDTLLLKDPVFKVCSIAFLFSGMGYFPIFVILADVAMETGHSRDQGVNLIMIMGITHTIGRIFAGIAADKCDRLHIWAISLCLGGIAVMFIGFELPFSVLSTLVGIFSFFGGAVPSLFSVILADLFGIKRIASTIGGALAIFSLGTFLGVPIAGWLFKATGNYATSCIFIGTCLFLGGFFLPFVKMFLQHPEHIQQRKLFEEHEEFEIQSQRTNKKDHTVNTYNTFQMDIGHPKFGPETAGG